jgi:hypothetical protein
MVAILDRNFKLISLRKYENVKVFYSVHAQDGYYFVCGQMQKELPYNNTGIVLRDALAAPMNYSDPNMWAFRTDLILFPNWVFHKIIVNEAPDQSIPLSFSVLGEGNIADKKEKSCAVFSINEGFSHNADGYYDVSINRIYLVGCFDLPPFTKKYKESEINKEVNNN